MFVPMRVGALSALDAYTFPVTCKLADGMAVDPIPTYGAYVMGLPATPFHCVVWNPDIFDV